MSRVFDEIFAEFQYGKYLTLTGISCQSYLDMIHYLSDYMIHYLSDYHETMKPH